MICWGADIIEHLGLFLSCSGCICTHKLGCELIVRDPMPFNNWNFNFISQRKKKKNYVEKKEKKKRKEKQKNKIKWMHD